MCENGLRRKLRFFSKFMTLQTGKQIYTIHILPNISRSQGNQTMEFGQLIEYKVFKVFLQKSCRKKSRGASSGLLFVFLKKLYMK